jgi:putative Holliday junction resolvase
MAPRRFNAPQAASRHSAALRYWPMPVLPLAELRAALAPGRRLIGLDPGRRTIGIALSDAGLTLATPHGQIPRGKLAAVAAAVSRLARAEGADGLVIGIPLEMDGTFGPAAQAARDWAHALSAATGLPAAMWDERLSSAAVNRFLISEADASRARRAARVDQMAAAWILQAALDATCPA